MGARKRIEQAKKGTIRMMYFSMGLIILLSLRMSWVCLHPSIVLSQLPSTRSGWHHGLPPNDTEKSNDRYQRCPKNKRFVRTFGTVS